MTRREGIALGLAAGYIALMAVAQAVMLNVFHLVYGQPDMMFFLVFAEVILAAFAWFAYRRWVHGTPAGRGAVFAFHSSSVFGGRDRWPHWLWWLPTWVVLGLMVYNIAAYAVPDMARANALLLVASIVGTLLVGISEEVMFRGVLMPIFMEKRNVLVAIIVSGIAFGLLHAVNILGGQPGPVTVQQIISTTIMGLFYGALTVRCGTLMPAIITHWLWDCFIISGAVTGVNNLGIAGLGQVIEIGLVVPLIIVLVVKQVSAQVKAEQAQTPAASVPADGPRRAEGIR